MSENIVAGMDLDKLEAFRKALEDNPITLGLRSRSVWEGHTGRNTTHIGPFRLGDQEIDRETRHYTIQYGAWKEVEETMGAVGPTDRAEPVEMALGAVGACLCNSIGLNAARHGINLEDMEVTVSADVDPSVLFELKGPEAHTSCIPNIRCEVKVKGDLTDEQLQEIKRLVAYSPVHGMMSEKNDIQSTVVRA
ncbi:MAG: OsmC family protein [Acidobacteriota bacterium]